MSTSSNKSSKRGEEGMGKAGKRYQMVTDIYIYERLACERVVCMSVCVYVCVCMTVCMCVCARCVATHKTCPTP